MGQSRGEERASSLRSSRIRVFNAVVRSRIDIMTLRSRPPSIFGYKPCCRDTNGLADRIGTCLMSGAD